MLSVIALVVGLLGMFGLWWLAWQLWTQALATPPRPSAGSSGIGQSTWRNEPTPEPPAPARQQHSEVPPAPPEERTEIEEAPLMRAHASSSANTAFFARTDIAALVESKIEKTEILLEDDILEEPTLCKDKPAPAPPVAPTNVRKTKFFPGPPPPLAR
jgi:hypothetical protein